MKVPWLPKDEIQALAASVIDDYSARFHCRITPPVPVEAIIEQHFDLKLGFIDFERDTRLQGVLGAVYVDQRLICVHRCLVESPWEGRLNFTLAHELGHWLLHRHLVKGANRCGEPSDAILCRAAEARKPIEWQADYFAACLLMPADWMQAAYETAIGPAPLVLNRVDSCCSGPLYREPCVQNWPFIAAAVQKAGRLSNVSKQSIIIRLQELGMIINATAAPLTWHTGLR